MPIIGTFFVDCEHAARGDTGDCLREDALSQGAGRWAQTATLTAFTWSNIRIDDLTSGASLIIKGTFSG